MRTVRRSYPAPTIRLDYPYSDGGTSDAIKAKLLKVEDAVHLRRGYLPCVTRTRNQMAASIRCTTQLRIRGQFDCRCAAHDRLYRDKEHDIVLTYAKSRRSWFGGLPYHKGSGITTPPTG